MNKAIKKLMKNKMRFYVIIISVVSLLVIIGLSLMNKNKDNFQSNKEPLTDNTIKDAVLNYFYDSDESRGKGWVVEVYGDISEWNTSYVYNMIYLFKDIDFSNDIDISNWDTSQVTNMMGMFKNSNFNGDISKWDTSNVSNMLAMFELNYEFNGDISKWNTSNVENMAYMFWGANSFNQDIKTKIVKYKDSKGNEKQYTAWDTSNVMKMDYMFMGANSFSQDISNWDISATTKWSRGCEDDRHLGGLCYMFGVKRDPMELRGGIIRLPSSIYSGAKKMEECFGIKHGESKKTLKGYGEDSYFQTDKNGNTIKEPHCINEVLPPTYNKNTVILDKSQRNESDIDKLILGESDKQLICKKLQEL